MRARLAILLALVLVIPLVLATASPADAIDQVVLAQEEGGQVGDPAGDGDPVGEEEGSEGGETNSQSGDGQSDADAETGASEDEQAGTEEVEAGPVWTYQMSKIVIALLFLMALGIGAAYYKLVVQRQRAGV